MTSSRRRFASFGFAASASAPTTAVQTQKLSAPMVWSDWLPFLPCGSPQELQLGEHYISVNCSPGIHPALRELWSRAHFGLLTVNVATEPGAQTGPGFVALMQLQNWARTHFMGRSIIAFQNFNRGQTLRGHPVEPFRGVKFKWSGMPPSELIQLDFLRHRQNVRPGFRLRLYNAELDVDLHKHDKFGRSRMQSGSVR